MRVPTDYQVGVFLPLSENGLLVIIMASKLSVYDFALMDFIAVQSVLCIVQYFRNKQVGLQWLLKKG